MPDKRFFRTFDFSDYDGVVRVGLYFDAESNQGTLRVEVNEANGWSATHELPFSTEDFKE